MRGTSLLFKILVVGGLFAEGAFCIVPVTVLGNQADLVVVASVQQMTSDSTGGVEISLQQIVTLKGQSPPSPFEVRLDPSPLMMTFAGQQIAKPAGATGVWFLRKTAGVYGVLPTEQGDYTEKAAFLPVTAWWVPNRALSLDEMLLDALVSSYQALSNPSTFEEGRLFVSLENADRGVGLRYAGRLMDSPVPDQRAVGFAAAIRIGSDDALMRLAQEVETLRSSNKFNHIVLALQTYYQPNGNSSILPLRRLVELHSDVAGLDVAVGKALQKIGTKETLPAIVVLLDSPDPLAQSTAAWYFGFYAALAGPDGNINRSGDGQHPFWSEGARQHTPKRSSTSTVAEQVSFWKAWWAENRTKLGFGEQQAQ
jgi:hypothetical protein